MPEQDVNPENIDFIYERAVARMEYCKASAAQSRWIVWTGNPEGPMSEPNTFIGYYDTYEIANEELKDVEFEGPVFAREANFSVYEQERGQSTVDWYHYQQSDDNDEEFDLF